MRYFAAVVLLFFAVLSVPSSLASAPPSSTESTGLLAPFAAEDEGLLLTLSGSNTVGAKLAPAWARAYLEAKGARNLAAMGLPEENEYRIVGRNGNRLVYIDIQAHGTGTGFVSLEKGTADIAMASRPVKADERTRLLKLGDLYEADAEHVVAIDGLAIIVHPDNPLHQLPIEAIAAVFAGKIRNWRELGGPDTAINLYARDEKSGTWDTFQSLVLDGKMQLSPRARRFESNDELSDSVAADPNAIGFVGLASVRTARAIAVSQGDSPAMPPQKLFVATEDYALARRLFLYHATSPANPRVGEFVAFAQHEMGQALVEQIGFVSQTPMEVEVSDNSGPAFYQALAQQARRLSVNFRFRTDSAVLDNKAKRDIERLAAYLKQAENRELHIQLVGFSTQQPDPALAGVLSRLRATAVKTALFEHGVSTEPVVGFGAERLLSLDKNGKNKNDRVEVWLYPPARALAIEQLKAANYLLPGQSAPALKLADQR